MLQEFRVPEEEALTASLMKYLEGDQYKWLQEHWIPKLVAIAGTELPAVGIAMNIAGTLVALDRKGSGMKEKPLTSDSLDKICATEDLKLFSLFFESKEVAEKAWKQLPPSMPDRLIKSAEKTSAVLAPLSCEVISTSGDRNTAGGLEEELKHKGSSTVDGSSSCGPAWSGPSTAVYDQPPSLPSINNTSFGILHYSEDEKSSTSSRPKHKGSSTVDGSSSCGPAWSGPSTAVYDQPPSLPSINNTSFGILHYSEDEKSSTSSRPKQEGPNRVYHFQSFGPPGAGPSTAPYDQPPSLYSINNTSFGIMHHSEDEESSTFSLSKHEGPNRVYHFQSFGRLGGGQFPTTSSSLPLIFTHPSACGLPTPFADVPSSTSPGVTSYADTEQCKDDRSRTSSRSEVPWAGFGLVMDGVKLVDDDGVVFETSSYLNYLHRLSAKKERHGEEET